MPLNYLILLLTITALAAVAHIIATAVRRRFLCRLARQWKMHYSPRDRLRLSPRVVDHVPHPGASDVRVIDLIFRTTETGHRYLFTIEYGLGVVRAKRRRSCVAGFDEPIAGAPITACKIARAPEGVALAKAYEFVNEALNSPDASRWKPAGSCA